MTKQFKKGLVAVLVVLMAVLVGFTANAVIGTSQADEKPNAVVKFEKYVTQLPELTDDQCNGEYLFTGIMGEEKVDLGKAIAIWNTYNSAKIQMAELGNVDQKYIDEIADLVDRFDKYDAVLNTAYIQLSRFRSDMKKIANAWDQYTSYDASHGKVEELGADIATWEAEKETAGSIYYYIYNTSSEYYEYNRALKLMREYEEKFENIGKLVGAINYYDETALTMKGAEEADMYDPENQDQKIVLSSEESINAVTEALKELKEVDYKYIKNPNGESDEEGATLAIYNKAVEEFAKLGELVDEVIEKIDTAYAAKEDKVTYYTVRDLIDIANEAYKNLVAEARYEGGEETAENYNDLTVKVMEKVDGVSAKDKLDEMIEYLRVLDEETIVGVVDKINAIDALDEASYTKAYLESIKVAEDEFAKLDADIKAHDNKVYEILAKRAADDYDEANDADKAADDEYLAADDKYMPEGKDYIVEGFDKLMDSRAQYDAWTNYIKGLIEKVKEIVNLQQNHSGEGVTDLLAELNEPYTNTRAPWRGKDTMYHRNAFLHAVESNLQIPESEIAYEEYMVESPYPSREDEGKVTAYEVLSYFFMVRSEIQATVNDIETAIRNLVETINEDGCVYGQRDVLLGIWDKYSALENYVPEFDSTSEAMDLRNWVSNHKTLESLYNEFVAEDELVKAWAATIEAIELPVNVAGFEVIATAETAFKAIVHGTTENEVDFGKFLAAEKKDHKDFVLDYSKEYDKYSKAITARDLLKSKIEKLASNIESEEDDVVDSMIEIDTNDSKPLPLDQVIDWTSNVNAIKARYEAIADDKTAEEENVDYTGAQEYLRNNFKEAYANYEKALRLIERYEVEAAIEKLPAAEYVALADKEAIMEAWDLHDAYLKKYHTSETENTDEWRAEASHNDFRNDQKLHDCLDKINEINQTLNAWMRKVVALYEEIDEDADLTKIEEALKNAEEFAGYPLDLTAWTAISEEYVELVGEDAERTAYVANAKTALDNLNAKSDEVIEGLQERIDTLAAKIKDAELTAEDIQEVSDIQDLYNNLHKTQQAKITGFDDGLIDARDTLVAVEAFKEMMSSLYSEVVVNKNVTSYVQFYIDLVKTSYAQFTADIRKSFDDEKSVNYIEANGYTKNIQEIQAAFDKALEDGTVVRLSELKEEFDNAQKELIEALNGLSTLEGESDAKSALKEAFAAFENRITEAYTAAIATEIGKLDTKLQGLIDAEKDLREAGDKKAADDLVAAKTELQGKINTAKTELQEAIAKEATDRAAALDTVNTNIGNLKTELEEKITNDIAALRVELQEVIDAEEAARKAGDDAAAEALKTAREALEKAIDAAKKALKNDMEQLKKDLEKADAELKAAMEKADAELKSVTSTLTILVIILGIMVLAALACIIILFVKRK